MKPEKFFELIGQADESLVAEAAEYPKKREQSVGIFVRMLAAACFTLAIGVGAWFAWNANHFGGHGQPETNILPAAELEEIFENATEAENLYPDELQLGPTYNEIIEITQEMLPAIRDAMHIVWGGPLQEINRDIHDLMFGVFTAEIAEGILVRLADSDPMEQPVSHGWEISADIIWLRRGADTFSVQLPVTRFVIMHDYSQWEDWRRWPGGAVPDDFADDWLDSGPDAITLHFQQTAGGWRVGNFELETLRPGAEAHIPVEPGVDSFFPFAAYEYVGAIVIYQNTLFIDPLLFETDGILQFELTNKTTLAYIDTDNPFRDAWTSILDIDHFLLHIYGEEIQPWPERNPDNIGAPLENRLMFFVRMDDDGYVISITYYPRFRWEASTEPRWTEPQSVYSGAIVIYENELYLDPVEIYWEAGLWPAGSVNRRVRHLDSAETLRFEMPDNVRLGASGTIERFSGIHEWDAFMQYLHPAYEHVPAQTPWREFDPAYIGAPTQGRPIFTVHVSDGRVVMIMYETGLLR